MAERDPEIDVETSKRSPIASGRPRATWTKFAIMGAVPLLLLAVGIYYWQSLEGKVSTDNAYVHVDKVAVSAEVSGKIVEIHADENGHVKAGDLLFRIDPEPYRLQLIQADAAIATAQANQIALSNSSALSGADRSAAQAQINFARSNMARQEVLWKRGFTTKAAYDAARHQVEIGEEALRLAKAKEIEAAAKLASGTQIPGVFPQLATARAQRAAAELQLRRTEVRAPVTGRITQASRMKLGQEMITGLPVLTLVEDGSSFVEANFKETDLEGMRVGQSAEIKLDAYSNIRLKGHVASIGAGTGSDSSILPAQNATGNWVKVTQRVPVRITLDEPSPRPLIAGLSAKVTVFTDGRKR
jgi:membrane fusion protein, multidrug efflux system